MKPEILRLYSLGYTMKEIAEETQYAIPLIEETIKQETGLSEIDTDSYGLFEIIDYSHEKVYTSKRVILLRGLKGFSLCYLYDKSTGLHVVEKETTYYTQEGVFTHFKSKDEALDFMFGFEEHFPSLHRIKTALKTKHKWGIFKLYDSIGRIPLSPYLLSGDDTLEQLTLDRPHSLMLPTNDNVVLSSDNNFLVPDYSNIELRVLASLNINKEG